MSPIDTSGDNSASYWVDSPSTSTALSAANLNAREETLVDTAATLAGAYVDAQRLAANATQVLTTDADFTLTVAGNDPQILHTGTLTADRTVTLSASGAAEGSRFKISRSGSGAFALIVGALKRIGQSQWAEFVYDGSAWQLTASGDLVFEDVVSLNQQAGTTYSFQVSDVDRVVGFTANTAVTATLLASTYPVGAQIDFMQLGSGAVTVTGASGVTVTVPASKSATTLERNSRASALQIALNQWVVTGDLAAPGVSAKTTSIARVSLANGTTPQSRTNHIIYIRARKTSSSGQATARVQLYEGATARSAELETPELTTSFADYPLDIGDTNAAAITDYTAGGSGLEVRFRGYSSTGVATTVEVAEIWFEVPPAVVGGGGTFDSSDIGSLVWDANYAGGVLSPQVVVGSYVTRYNTLHNGSRMAIVDDPILGSSRKVLRIIASDTDLSDVADTTAVRVQADGANLMTLGQTRYIGCSVLIPAGSPTTVPSALGYWLLNETFCQYQVASPTIALQLRPIGGVMYLAWERNQFSAPFSAGSYPWIWTGPTMASIVGTWVDIVWGVKWSNDPTQGWLEMWLRTSGTGGSNGRTDGWTMQTLHGTTGRVTTQTQDQSPNGTLSNSVITAGNGIAHHYRNGGFGATWNNFTHYTAEHRIGATFDSARPHTY